MRTAEDLRDAARPIREQRALMARELVVRLKAAFKPLTERMGSDQPQSLYDLVRAHVAMVIGNAERDRLGDNGAKTAGLVAKALKSQLF